MRKYIHRKWVIWSLSAYTPEFLPCFQNLKGNWYLTNPNLGKDDHLCVLSARNGNFQKTLYHGGYIVFMTVSSFSFAAVFLIFVMRLDIWDWCSSFKTGCPSWCLMTSLLFKHWPSSSLTELDALAYSVIALHLWLYVNKCICLSISLMHCSLQ